MDKDEKNRRIEELEHALRDALSDVRPDLTLNTKNMFGGAGFYADEIFFGAWFGDGLALKLSADDIETVMQMEGAVKPWAKQYVEVPERFVQSPQMLAPWLEKSIEHSNASSKPKTKKKVT